MTVCFPDCSYVHVDTEMYGFPLPPSSIPSSEHAAFTFCPMTISRIEAAE